MKVMELIRNVPLEQLTIENWNYYRPDENAEITPDFRKAILRLVLNTREVVFVEKCNVIDVNYSEDNVFDVFAVDKAGNVFSFMFLHWNEVLGYTVPPELIKEIGNARLAAAILYEMMWLCSSNEEN